MRFTYIEHEVEISVSTQIWSYQRVYCMYTPTQLEPKARVYIQTIIQTGRKESNTK
jgi:hypothetical protein